MIDDLCRRTLRRVVGDLVLLYPKLGLTPNRISLFGCLGAVGAATLVATSHSGWALCAWWLSRFLDGTDGIYARKTGQSSAFGAYLDILLDMAAYGVMVIGFYALHPSLFLSWLAIMFLYILCITSALALGHGESELGRKPRDNRGLRLGAGLAEAGETGIAYSLFLLFPGWIGGLSAVWILVLVTTVIARTWLAWRVLK